MVIMALDVETYKYDEKTKTYKPSLNTRDFVLGCIMISGRKNPIFFYNADEMFKYIFEFVKQKRTEGHNTFIYGHKHIYDLASYGMNYMHRVDILKIFVQNPLFAKLQPKTKMQIKCKRCKDEYTYEGNETVINCPKCRERKLLPTGFLLDTRSFYKSKLEDVGRLLGFPKLEMPKEIENIHQLRNYVKRDVEITLNSIFELKNKMNLLGHNPKKLLTSGSLAMTYFKTWLKKQKYKDTTYSGYLYQKGKIHPTKFHNFIRMAYRGARCECFHSGKYENVTMIDINSLYPKVLSEMKMPDLLSEQRIIDPLFMYSKEELLNKIGIAKAKIKVPNKDGLMYMPCKREGKGIYFPNKIQELTSYWTLFELKRAEMEGYEILEIYDSVIYRELPFNPFKEFMVKLYNLRKDSDEIFNKVIKILMNSLGSKFAQYRPRTERKVCHRAEYKKFEKMGYYIENEFGEQYMIRKDFEKVLPKYAHPIITIMMTAYARDYLYWNLKKIPFKDLLYCDTDSIAFKGNYIEKFNINNELGEWKIEFENSIGEFVKEKIYKIENPLKNKKKVVYSGIVRRDDLSKKQLWGEEVITNRNMYTPNMAYRTGNFEKVGTFFDKTAMTNPQFKKRNVKFPAIYCDYNQDQINEADSIEAEI